MRYFRIFKNAIKIITKTQFYILFLDLNGDCVQFVYTIWVIQIRKDLNHPKNLNTFIFGYFPVTGRNLKGSPPKS